MTCEPTSKPPLLVLLPASVAIFVQAQPQAAVELVTTKQAIPKNSVITKTRSSHGSGWVAANPIDRPASSNPTFKVTPDSAARRKIRLFAASLHSPSDKIQKITLCVLYQ
jgi:hypothetical protein